jgi:hypothetical protein
MRMTKVCHSVRSDMKDCAHRGSRPASRRIPTSSARSDPVLLAVESTKLLGGATKSPTLRTHADRLTNSRFGMDRYQER